MLRMLLRPLSPFKISGRLPSRKLLKCCEVSPLVSRRYYGKKPRKADELKGWKVPHHVGLRLLRDEPHHPARHLIYENTILQLLKVEKFGEAKKVFQDMQNEGLVPPPALRILMQVVSARESSANYEGLLGTIKASLSSEFKTSGRTCKLLRVLIALDYPSNFIEQVIEAHIDSKEPGYRPNGILAAVIVKFHSRRGDLNSVERWLNVDSSEFVKGEKIVVRSQGSSHAARPYGVLLSEAIESNHEDLSTIMTILNMMRDDGVTPDIAIFNMLINLQIRLTAYSKVFELHRFLMKTFRDGGVTPDGITFGSFFKVLTITSLPRSGRTRRYRKPANAPSPRAVFRDMISCHRAVAYNHPKLPSSVITTSVLNNALKTFMVVGDHPSAFVVIRSFSVYNLSPNVQTYLIIMGNLKLPDTPLTFDAINEVLGVEKDVKNVGSAGSYKRKRYTIPTPQMLANPLEFATNEFDVVPLERILRHAIAGSLAGSGEGVIPISKEVSESISAAKREMIPPPLKVTHQSTGRRKEK